MNKDFNRRNIANLLETIVEQFQGINQYEGKIPRIETDLMLSNIRNLYESVIQLDKSASMSSGMSEAYSVKENLPVSVHAEQEEIPEVLPLEEAKIELSSADSGIKAEVIIPESGIEEETEAEFEEMKIVDVEIVEDENLIIAEIEEEREELVEQIPVFENVQEELHESGSAGREKTETLKSEKPLPSGLPGLFDDIPAEKETVTENPVLAEKAVSAAMVKQGGNKSIIEKAQHKPISDLRTAIGINEKYSFINELFKGDADAYASSLQAINSSASKAGANEIIDHADKKYVWNKEGRAYNAFIDLVERRFLPS
jgi:hypothetical protein